MTPGEPMDDFVPNTTTFKPFQGWKSGLPDHIVFMVRLSEFDDEKRINRNVKEIQRVLGATTAYIPFPEEYLHITLKSSGFLDDKDYTKVDLDAIVDGAPDALSGISPFRIRLCGLGIFPSVIFLGVEDGGMFSKLNESLLKLPKVRTHKFDHPNFKPHMALGTFKEGENISKLLKSVDRQKSIVIGEAEIRFIDLVLARWSGTEFPKFQLIKRLSL